MKTIFYLIDLVSSRMLHAYEGGEGPIPQPIQDEIQGRANKTGHAHVLARGKLFFQADDPPSGTAPQSNETTHEPRFQADDTPSGTAPQSNETTHGPEGVPGPSGPEAVGDAPGPTLEDLQAEHEAMRVMLLQVMGSYGVLDQESMRAPWDAPTVLHFASLWISGALPWGRTKATLQALQVAVQRLGRDLDEKVRHLESLVAERFEVLDDRFGDLPEAVWVQALKERLETVTELQTRVDGIEESVGALQQAKEGK